MVQNVPVTVTACNLIGEAVFVVLKALEKFKSFVAILDSI